MSYGKAIFLLLIFFRSLPSPAQLNTVYTFQQDDKILGMEFVSTPSLPIIDTYGEFNYAYSQDQ